MLMVAEGEHGKFKQVHSLTKDTFDSSAVQERMEIPPSNGPCFMLEACRSFVPPFLLEDGSLISLLRGVDIVFWFLDYALHVHCTLPMEKGGRYSCSQKSLSRSLGGWWGLSVVLSFTWNCIEEIQTQLISWSRETDLRKKSYSREGLCEEKHLGHLVIWERNAPSISNQWRSEAKHSA